MAMILLTCAKIFLKKTCAKILCSKSKGFLDLLIRKMRMIQTFGFQNSNSIYLKPTIWNFPLCTIKMRSKHPLFFIQNSDSTFTIYNIESQYENEIQTGPNTTLLILRICLVVDPKIPVKIQPYYSWSNVEIWTIKCVSFMAQPKFGYKVKKKNVCLDCNSNKIWQKFMYDMLDSYVSKFYF